MNTNISGQSKFRIESIVFSATGNMFAFFCNPKFRGDQFNWNDFPAWCQERAPMWVHGSMPRASSSHIEYAKGTAFLYATSLIKEAGVTQ